MNDNRSDTSAFGCRATAIWNSSAVSAIISISSSAATCRFIASMTAGCGSALENPRYAALSSSGLPLAFSGRAALRLPRRLCRNHFPLATRGGEPLVGSRMARLHREFDCPGHPAAKAMVERAPGNVLSGKTFTRPKRSGSGYIKPSQLDLQGRRARIRHPAAVGRRRCFQRARRAQRCRRSRILECPVLQT